VTGRSSIVLLAVAFGGLLAGCDSGGKNAQAGAADTVTVTVTSEAEGPLAPIDRAPRIRCGVDSGLDPTVGIRERHATVEFSEPGDGDRLTFPHFEATFGYRVEHGLDRWSIQVSVWKRGAGTSEYIYRGQYLLPAQDDVNVINQMGSFTPDYFAFDDEQAGITGLQTVVDRETGAYLRYACRSLDAKLTVKPPP
jgi:hypothetical protein